MRTWLVGLALALGLAACGGRSAAVGDAPPAIGAPWTGNVNATQCTTTTADVPMLRCLAASGSASLATAVCGDLAADNTLTVGPLAVAGHSRTGAPLHVAGSFTSLGGADATNTEDITGDLLANADVTVSSPMHVGGLASIRGALAAKNTVSITGALHLGQPLDANAAKNVTASSIATDAAVTASPLDCAHAPDLAALLAGAAIDEGDALASVTEPTTLTVGCGRYALSTVAVNNTLDLHIDGHTVMLVKGDFHIAAPMHITIAAGGSLDLLVGGSLFIDNTLAIAQSGGLTGTASGAWVAVGGEVHVAAPLTLDGWLLAPKGALGVDNTVSLAGAAYVGALRVASPMNVTPGPSFDGAGCVLP